MSEDVKPSDSSSAPVDPLTAKADAMWNDVVKAQKAETTPADSSPAPSGEQSATTVAKEPAPASEPGKPAPANAETRVKELLAERHTERTQWNTERAELLRRVEALERPKSPDATPEKSSPSTTEPPTLAALIKEPDVTRDILSETQFFAAYPDAMVGDYARYAARYEINAERAAEKQRAQAESVNTTFNKRIETYLGRMAKAAEADPTFEGKLKPDVLALKASHGMDPKAIGPLNILADEMLESEHVDKLALHFSEHPEEFARFGSMRSMREVTRAFAVLESSLVTPTKATTEPSKTLTDAPNPPVTLGTKTTDSGDRRETAVAKGDFRSFHEEETRRELARLR